MNAYEIIAGIELTFKVLFDNLISLVFAPVWVVYNIVVETIDVWTASDEKEEVEDKPQEQHKIGFHQ